MNRDADLASLELRDRLLTALLEPSSTTGRPLAVPLDILPGLAVLGSEQLPRPLVLVTAGNEEAGALQRLERQIASIEASPQHAGLFLLVVGGGAETERCLRAAFSDQKPKRQAALYQLEDGGKLHQFYGLPTSMVQGLPRLLEPGSGQPPLAPMTPGRLAELQARWDAERQQELQFSASVHRRPPRVMQGLIAANVLIFFLELVWGNAFRQPSWLQDNRWVDLVVQRMGANGQHWILDGELWRLLASAFLHGSVLHLIVNLVALYSFGTFLEGLLGARRFLVLYGLSALGGGLASAFLQQTVAVGASGAIWGLMMAGIGLALWPRGLVPPMTLARLKSQALPPLVINVLYSFTPGIDLYAHFGGGLVGFLLMASGLLTVGLRSGFAAPQSTLGAASPARSFDGLLGALAGVLTLAMALSVVLGIALGRPWELLQPPAPLRVELPEVSVSLEVPAGLELEKLDEGQARGLHAFGLGRLDWTPGAFEVLVAGLSQPVPAEAVEAWLEQTRKELEQNQPSDQRDAATFQLVQIGGRPALTSSRTTSDGMRIQVWVTLLQDRQVILRLYLRPEAAEAWKETGEHAFRTLQVEATGK